MNEQRLTLILWLAVLVGLPLACWWATTVPHKPSTFPETWVIEDHVYRTALMDEETHEVKYIWDFKESHWNPIH